MRNTAQPDYSAAVSTISYEFELIIANLLERSKDDIVVPGEGLWQGAVCWKGTAFNGIMTIYNDTFSRGMRDALNRSRDASCSWEERTKPWRKGR